MTIWPQLDVPVLIETSSRSAFPMVRCHYLSIECDDPRPGWNLGLQGPGIPFLMLNLVGIVQQPFGAPRFNTNGLIDGLFELIENQATLTINFEDIWLPDLLFQPQPSVGDVYRVGNNLFSVAYQYRDGRHSRDTFENLCKELHRDIVLSEDETRAFKGWTAEQFSTAQNRPPKDPNIQLPKREER